MKKLLLAIFIVIAAAAIALLFLGKGAGTGEKLLTESETQLTKIEIVLEPNISPIKLAFDDQETMNKIYETIKESTDLRMNKKPTHVESMQSDSRFNIVLFYQDDKSDSIQSTETGETIYRLLDTKGSSGDPGYVIAKNTKLQQLFLELTD